MEAYECRVLWPNACFRVAGGAGTVTKSLCGPHFVTSLVGGRQVMIASFLMGVWRGFV